MHGSVGLGWSVDLPVEGGGWVGQLNCLVACQRSLYYAACIDWLVACMLTCLLAQPAFATTCLGCEASCVALQDKHVDKRMPARPLRLVAGDPDYS